MSIEMRFSLPLVILFYSTDFNHERSTTAVLVEELLLKDKIRTVQNEGKSLSSLVLFFSSKSQMTNLNQKAVVFFLLVVIIEKWRMVDVYFRL